MTLDDLLSRLDGVQGAGQFRYKARCPAHPDHDASLSVGLGQEGILLYCHAHCPFHKVASALGVTARDLKGGGGFAPSEPAVLTEEDRALRDHVYHGLVATLKLFDEHRNDLIQRGLSVAAIERYEYRSGDRTSCRYACRRLLKEYGADLFRVPGFIKQADGARLAVTDGLFIPVRDNLSRILGVKVRTGGEVKYKWQSSSSNSIHSPAHIPVGAWAAAGRAVRITEGPLKADVATFLDPTVPTVAVGGVSAWRSILPALWDGLDTFYLAFDADWQTNPQVAKAMAELWAALERAYPGAAVLVEAWDKSDGKGIDDLLANGKRPQVLDARPEDIEPSWEELHPDDHSDVIVRASTVTPRPVYWLWDQTLLGNELQLLDGDPGLGKSTLDCFIAARLSRGEPFPGDVRDREPRNVIMVSAEDDMAQTIVPRLMAADADLERIYFWEGKRKEGKPYVALPEFPGDLDRLIRQVRQLKPALVIIDPLYAHVDPEYDAFKDQHIRQVLGPLSKEAHNLQFGILAVRHLNKNEAQKALYRGGGSIGTIGAARLGLIFAPDPDRPEDGRYLAISKSNLGSAQRPQPWKIALKNWREGEITAPYVEFLGQNAISLDELLKDEAPKKPSPDQFAARQFLHRLLAAGPVAKKECLAKATAEGITDYHLRKARGAEGVREVTVAGVRCWALATSNRTWTTEAGNVVTDAKAARFTVTSFGEDG